MSNSNQSSVSLKEMTKSQRERFSWLFNPGNDIGGGIVATFCLLPEVMGFMLSIGIPPYMGLFTCITLTITLAIVGGRPGVITACAGATATICAGLISKFFISGTHPEYLFAAVLFAGIIQIILGLIKFGNLIKFIPESIMHGFVNGLASLILISQIKMLLKEKPDNMPELLIVVAFGIGIIVAFDFFKKAVKVKFLQYIPSPMVCVVLVSVYAMAGHRPIMRIVDLGSVVPNYQFVGSIFRNFGNVFTGEGMAAVLPVAVSVAFIGLVETMLTSRLVSEETKTPELTDLNRECRGQGIGNIICSFVGTMPGCAMIAPTTANVNSGGKGRLSTLTTGLMMAVLLFALSPVLSAIPLAALIAVMLYTCFETYNWDSIIHANRHSVIDTFSMLLVVAVVLGTDNLAFGVVAGLIVVAVSLIFKLFVPGKVSVAVAYIILGVSAAIAWFGIGTAFAVILSAVGISVSDAARSNFDSETPGKVAVVLNAIAFAGSIFLIVLNSVILPGHFQWYSV